MKLTEGAVGFHLGNDGIDKDEEIVLPLAHQHTDFSVGERVLDKRCSEAWVLVQPARIHHHTHLWLVDVGLRLETICLVGTASFAFVWHSSQQYFCDPLLGMNSFPQYLHFLTSFIFALF